jgi:hypothetical protein
MSYNADVWGGEAIAGVESAGGKSELRRAGCRVTPGKGNLKESATENIPPPVIRR